MKPNLRFQAFYLFFIIISIQIGVGIMGAPRLIFLEAGHDAWISIIIAYIYIIIVLTVMIIILKQYENADILGIQVDIFGKWFGKLLGSIYLVYIAIMLFSVLITYVEVVRVYIFPELDNYVISLLLIFLLLYAVHGGLRVIIGVCFLFIIFTHWILILLIQPATEIDVTHFQPVLQASMLEILNGAKASSYTLAGFEILFFVYPFIQNKKNIKRISFLATGWSTLILLIISMIAIGFYSFEQVSRREWVVLDLFKVQEFSFIERLDYLIVAGWMMIVVPQMILYAWVITYGTKRLFKVKQKYTLYIIAVLALIGVYFVDDHFQIQKVIDIAAKFGLWIAYIYPFILLPIVLVKKRRGKKKGNQQHANT